MEKFNLSEKIFNYGRNEHDFMLVGDIVEDVKEFIRLLKQYFKDWHEQGQYPKLSWIEATINKLAGEKLTGRAHCEAHTEFTAKCAHCQEAGKQLAS